MKFDKMTEDKKNEILELLKSKEDKSEAIFEAIQLINETTNSDLIEQIKAESARAEYDKEYRSKLGLKVLSEKETKMVQMFKNPKQALTAAQTDIIPSETLDFTLENVKKNSMIASLIKFTPAGVKRWLTASKTGVSSWGTLEAPITDALTATFTGLDLTVNKLFVGIVVPKAIADLADAFVYKYITAIIQEAINDGIESGFVSGNGLDQPLGIMKTFEVNTDKTAKDKAVHVDFTGFSPKQLAPVKKLLSNGGLRCVPELELVCNISDCYQYIEPSLLGENTDGSYSQKSATKINLIPTANCPEGKAMFTLKNCYVMGFSGINKVTYKETKAMDDADLTVAKLFGNGRPIDINTAYVFDVTKLVEYIKNVGVVGTVTTKQAV